jgi:hypothetical protein
MRRRGFIAASLLTIPLMPRRGLAGSPPGVPTPVVLELFTSQGCSSCPPADALLGELTHTPGIIGLAWHVDYWNSLGWRDPFARPEWTERQKAYARHLNDEVYTPALVVNGAAMVVGSDKVAVRRAIEEAPPASVAVTLRHTGSVLEAEIGGASASMTGLLVTYDPERSTEVGAGENQGRRLTDYRVVREVTALDRLTPRLALPAIPKNRGAVLMVRDPDWHVVGAADLPPDVD